MKILRKIAIAVLLVGAVATTSKPALAGIPLGHGACNNGWAVYYELGWGGVEKYISGCTN